MRDQVTKNFLKGITQVKMALRPLVYSSDPNQIIVQIGKFRQATNEYAYVGCDKVSNKWKLYPKTLPALLRVAKRKGQNV